MKFKFHSQFFYHSRARPQNDSIYHEEMRYAADRCRKNTTHIVWLVHQINISQINLLWELGGKKYNSAKLLWAFAACNMHDFDLSGFRVNHNISKSESSIIPLTFVCLSPHLSYATTNTLNLNSKEEARNIEKKNSLIVGKCSMHGRRLWIHMLNGMIEFQYMLTILRNIHTRRHSERHWNRPERTEEIRLLFFFTII